MANLPARTVLSCALFPNNVGDKFRLASGGPIKAYPFAGVDLRLCFFNTESELYVPSNIATLYATVKETATSASSLIHTSIAGTALNPACSLDDWNAGISQHALIPLTSAQTAALHDKTDCHLVIWGATTDNEADYDVFGIAELKVVEAGIDSVTPATPVGETVITASALAGILGNYIKVGTNPNGAWFSLPSASGGHTTIFRTNDDGTPSIEVN